MPRYNVITFDCYGTLIDWESGIADAFLTSAAGDGVTLTREAVLRAYADTEHRVQAASYRPHGGRRRLAAHERTRGLPRRQPAVVATVPRHQRGAGAARRRQPPRHPVEHRRRSS